jgi:hypothetical protein
LHEHIAPENRIGAGRQRQYLVDPAEEASGKLPLNRREAPIETRRTENTAEGASGERKVLVNARDLHLPHDPPEEVQDPLAHEVVADIVAKRGDKADAFHACPMKRVG